MPLGVQIASIMTGGVQLASILFAAAFLVTRDAHQSRFMYSRAILAALVGFFVQVCIRTHQYHLLLTLDCCAVTYFLVAFALWFVAKHKRGLAIFLLKALWCNMQASSQNFIFVCCGGMCK